MASRYDRFFVTFVDYPFLWLWAFVTWLMSDEKISYKEAYKQHLELAKWRLK